MEKIFFLLFMALIGCATYPPQYKDSPKKIDLLSEASQVKIIEFLSTSDREKYDEVQLIKCSLGFNSQSAEENINSCHNKFKNETHKLNSSLFLLRSEGKRVGQDTVTDNASGRQINCANCVEMQGIVLLPKKK